MLANGGVLLFRALRDGDDGNGGTFDELRRAYTHGDIDDEEFDRHRERLDRNWRVGNRDTPDAAGETEGSLGGRPREISTRSTR